MIQLEYITDKDKSLLTIYFNRKVLDSLHAKCDDNIYYFQSIYKPTIVTLVKADTGYRIKRTANRKKIYQVTISHPLHYINEFDLKECTYFIKKTGLIKIWIK
jgi:hypothetical protein